MTGNSHCDTKNFLSRRYNRHWPVIKTYSSTLFLLPKKKIYGLISIAAIGMMIYVLQHYFGKLRFT